MYDLSVKTEMMSQGKVNPGERRFKPASVVYWLRFLLAVMAGVANNYLRITSTQPVWGNLAEFAGIALAASFYVVSILIVRYVLRYGEVELKGKHKDITLGGGTFIVVWIMILVLVNSLNIL